MIQRTFLFLLIFYSFLSKTTAQYAIIYPSVANGKATNGHKSELVTQILGGFPVKIIKKEDTWSYVKTIDNYTCWLQNNQLTFCTKEKILNYLDNEKVIYTNFFGSIYSESNSNSATIGDAVAGNLFLFEKEVGLFFQIKTSDGRTGFLLKNEVDLFSVWINKTQATAENFIQKAKCFTGIPYLWGGTSTKAIDCSGLVQLSFLLCGIVVPRDADDQEFIGTPITSKPDFSHAQAGDLFLFKDKTGKFVSHIGISLGFSKMLHSAGFVRTNDLLPNKVEYSPYFSGHYYRTIRYFDKPVKKNLPEKLRQILD